MKRFGQFLIIINLIVFAVALIHLDILAMALTFNGIVWGVFYAAGERM